MVLGCFRGFGARGFSCRESGRGFPCIRCHARVGVAGNRIGGNRLLDRRNRIGNRYDRVRVRLTFGSGVSLGWSILRHLSGVRIVPGFHDRSFLGNHFGNGFQRCFFHGLYRGDVFCHLLFHRSHFGGSQIGESTDRSRCLELLLDLRRRYGRARSRNREAEPGERSLADQRTCGGDAGRTVALLISDHGRCDPGTAGDLDLGSRRSTSLDENIGAVSTVVRNNTGRVDALSEQDRVVRNRGIDSGVIMTHELVGRDELVALWSEVVFEIAVPIGSPISISSGRKGRPTHMVWRLAPGNPGGSPLESRNPDPTDMIQIHPSPVVIGRPSEGLIRIPGPTMVGPRPAPIPVRLPPGIGSQVWLP